MHQRYAAPTIWGITILFTLSQANLFALVGGAGPGFTYQGELTQGGMPVTDTVDLRFRLLDDTLAPVGQFSFALGVPAVEGAFTATVNGDNAFGSDAFDGNRRQLEISVREAGDPNWAWTVLSPPQQITPAPYATYSLDGDQPWQQTSGTLSYNQGSVGIGTSNPNSLLQVGEDDGSSLRVGDSPSLVMSRDVANDKFRIQVAGNSYGGKYLHLGRDDGGHDVVMTGNVGIGTSDPAVPLDVAGEIRSSRLADTGQYLQMRSVNSTGHWLTARSRVSNKKKLTIQNVHADTGVPSGETDIRFEVGASSSPISAMRIRESGNIGVGTNAPDQRLHVAGNVKVDGWIGTDQDQPVQLQVNDLPGMTLDWHRRNGTYFDGETGQSFPTFVEAVNLVAGHPSAGLTDPNLVGVVVLGGFEDQGTFGGLGLAANTASGDSATVSGGAGNEAGRRATVGGGVSNTATGSLSAVGGGEGNSAANYASCIAGGVNNTVGGQRSSVGGGGGNEVAGDDGHIGGGRTNSVDGDHGVVGGGALNSVAGSYGVTSGGWNNDATGTYGAVGGGRSNNASGYSSTVPGGQGNTASGNYSFAAGRSASAVHDGTFVYSDASSGGFSSTGSNQFRVRAAGGVYFLSNASASTGVVLGPGAGSWAPASDRNVKRAIQPVDQQRILELVAELPITTWEYLSEPDGVRHMGPMAQDFYGAFGLGPDDRRITTIDADGVALAAIQGLHMQLEEKGKQIERLQQRHDETQRFIEELVARIDRFERNAATQEGSR